MTVGLCSLPVRFQSPDRTNCKGYCMFTNDFQWMITAVNACFSSLSLDLLFHILSLGPGIGFKIKIRHPKAHYIRG